MTWIVYQQMVQELREEHQEAMLKTNYNPNHHPPNLTLVD